MSQPQAAAIHLCKVLVIEQPTGKKKKKKKNDPAVLRKLLDERIEFAIGAHDAIEADWAVTYCIRKSLVREATQTYAASIIGEER